MWDLHGTETRRCLSLWSWSMLSLCRNAAHLPHVPQNDTKEDKPLLSNWQLTTKVVACIYYINGKSAKDPCMF